MHFPLISFIFFTNALLVPTLQEIIRFHMPKGCRGVKGALVIFACSCVTCESQIDIVVYPRGSEEIL